MSLARKVEHGIEMRIGSCGEVIVVPFHHNITLDGIIGTKVRLIPNVQSVTIEAFVGPDGQSMTYTEPVNDDDVSNAHPYSTVEHFVGDCLVQLNGTL